MQRQREGTEKLNENNTVKSYVQVYSRFGSVRFSYDCVSFHSFPKPKRYLLIISFESWAFGACEILVSLFSEMRCSDWFIPRRCISSAIYPLIELCVMRDDEVVAFISLLVLPSPSFIRLSSSNAAYEQAVRLTVLEFL